MSVLDTMRDLRGGVIYGAARIAPTTARTWALELGQAREGGHPRYGVADAVALVIMHQLTTGVGMAAGFASRIVNALQPTLPEVIERVVAEQEASRRWQWDGGPFAIVHRRPLGYPADSDRGWLTIIEVDDPGPEIARLESGLTPLVIPLRRLINKTVMALQHVLNGDIPPNDEPGPA